MDFPEQFPFKFPIVRFKTHIWHPNVKDGDICKEMVGEK
jgi:ubiquitin-protein ligase